MSEIIKNISDEQFEEAVLKEQKVVLVDFWAVWCGPCRMQSEVLKTVAPEYEGKVEFVKINVDENENIAMSFSVTSIPTLMIFKNGNLAEKTIGFIGAEGLRSMLNKYL